MDNHCIITGNPVDGFQIIGPFPDGDAALTYAGGISGDDWWITSLETPEDEDNG